VRVTLVLMALGVLAGCAPRDAGIRRSRLVAERRDLEASFDQLEDRLMVNQARVRFWVEMKERHESVTAISCASQDAHAEEMARHDVTPGAPERPFAARRPVLDRARVAAVSAEPAGGGAADRQPTAAAVSVRASGTGAGGFEPAAATSAVPP
jgi:hypothetical protein